MRTQAWVVFSAIALLLVPACGDDSEPVQPDSSVDMLTVDTFTPPDPDGPAPDALADQGPTSDATDGALPDGPAPDMPDSGTPDMGAPDVSMLDALPGDLGPPVAGKCATAPTVTLVSGTVTIKDDITRYTNEFATGCTTSTSSTTTMSGPQAYYQFSGVQNQWYRLTLKPTSTSFSAYMYVFTSAACTEAAIETDCTSDGVSGASLRNSADGDDPRVLYFKAPSNGPVYVAVDDTSTPTDGKFELTIDAIPTPTNGKCAGATQLTFTGGKAVANGDTHHVMTPDEFPGVKCPSTAMDGPQAYYKFNAVAGQTYKIKVTNKAGYFIYFYVFGNTCTEAAISTDCSSSGASGLYFSSSFDAPQFREVTFKPTTAGTYTIAIDGSVLYYNGSFTLEVEEFTPPTNGTCANPTPVTLTAGKATIKGTTLGVSNEYGTSITCGSTVDGPQAYYKLTAAAGKAYKMTFAPGYSAYWYVFQAGSCGSTSAINADCDSSGVKGAEYGFVSSTLPETAAFRPTVPGDYIIAVDSTAPTNAGGFQLEIEEFTAPTNDKACSATPVTFTSGKATINGSTLGANNEFGTTSTTGVKCGGSTVYDGVQLYYEFTASASKGYKLKLAPTNFSSAYMYVFQKSSCSSASAVNTSCSSMGASGAYTSSSASSTTSREFYFNPTNTGQYVVAVDTSLVPGGGDFVLTIEELSAPANQTCAAAQALALTNHSVSVAGFTVAATDEFGGAIKCGGTTAYAGGQTYYKLNMLAGVDYFVSLAADHKSAVYLFSPTSACKATAIETDCASGGTTGDFSAQTSASGGGAGFSFKPTTSGDYYIVVDTPTAGDIGSYTLGISDAKPTLSIAEINTGAADYLLIKNTGTTAAQIGGVQILMTDSTIASPDNAFTLPARTLKVGESVYVVETSSPAAGDIYIGGNIPYTYSASFTAMLCLGPCSASNAGNVIDLGRFGTTTTPEVPTGITWTGAPVGGLTSTNQNTSSFTRTGSGGMHPTFLATDWTVAAATR
jgi:hypothetical protein